MNGSSAAQAMYMNPLIPVLTLPMESLIFLLSVIAVSIAIGASWTSPQCPHCQPCHHQRHPGQSGKNSYNQNPTDGSSSSSHGTQQQTNTMEKGLKNKINHLTKRGVLLMEQITSLRREVAHERESRSVIEQTCQEKVKRAELDLEFKDTEVLQLRDRILKLEDELEDVSFSGGGGIAASGQSGEHHSTALVNRMHISDNDTDDEDGDEHDLGDDDGEEVHESGNLLTR